MLIDLAISGSKPFVHCNCCLLVQLVHLVAIECVFLQDPARSFAFTDRGGVQKCELLYILNCPSGLKCNG